VSGEKKKDLAQRAQRTQRKDKGKKKKQEGDYMD
jgi:hypothetical protein